MNKSRSYGYWHDARSQAIQASFIHGYAWIIPAKVERVTLGNAHSDNEFQVIASDRVDDAPAGWITEFMNGEEQ